MKNRRILIVDDSKTQLIYLQMALEKEGAHVITASDGLEGVGRAYNDKPELIVSDIVMPELNGYQLCSLLRHDTDTSDIPIILLTSLDQQQDKFWGFRAGATKYIVKNRDFTLLFEEINKILSEIPVQEKPPEASDKAMDLDKIRSTVNRVLDRLLFNSTVSNEVRNLSAFMHSETDLLKEVAGLVHSLIDYSCLNITLFEAGKVNHHLDIKRKISTKEIGTIEKLVVDEIKKSKTGRDNLNQWMEEDKDLFNTSLIEGSQEAGEESEEQIENSIIIPLRLSKDIIGYFSIFTSKEIPFQEESKKIISLFKNEFPTVFELMLLYGKARRLSITDGLTGLNNNRYFKEIFNKELERSQRLKIDLSLIMIDIDHFKAVNDTYGHLQGDSILREVSKVVQESIRKTDFAARYGGEEFAILAMGTNTEDTAAVAEKIRANIEKFDFKAEKGVMKITISLGICSLTKDTKNILEIVKSADDALYDAKETGRNCVRIGK